MHFRSVIGGALIAVVACLATEAAWAADEQAGRADAEGAVRTAAKRYVAALEQGDAAALAEFWTADADFVDALGETHPASELIAQAAEAAGSGERPRVKLLDSRIRFLTDDVAIEDGRSEVTRPGSTTAPSRGRFSAIWVKRDGTWRLASLREAPLAAPGRPARLADLSWMIGAWTATNGETLLEVSARWNATETFLLRDLKVSRDGKVIFRASQRIGWDPLEHKLKSWIFDSDGGYSVGTWSREGDSWLSESHGVLPDGRQTTATHLLTYDGQNHFTWKSTGAQTGSESSPGTELQFTRKTAESRP